MLLQSAVWVASLAQYKLLSFKVAAVKNLRSRQYWMYCMFEYSYVGKYLRWTNQYLPLAAQEICK